MCWQHMLRGHVNSGRLHIIKNTILNQSEERPVVLGVNLVSLGARDTFVKVILRTLHEWEIGKLVECVNLDFVRALIAF